MKTLKTLFQLFWVFLKIGAVMFGGGYAMLPILTRELVEKLEWTTEEELLDCFYQEDTGILRDDGKALSSRTEGRCICSGSSSCHGIRPADVLQE